MILDIILRTHSDTSIVKSPRIVSDPLPELKLKCIKSLVKAANFASAVNISARVIVFDDHSSEEFLTALSAILSDCINPVEIINLQERGFNNSAHKQFLKATESEYLVYLVEDDYFHAENAIVEMWNAYHFFKQRQPFSEVSIFPYDCPDRYDQAREAMSPTMLFKGGERYWRTVTQTTNTMFISAESIRKYFKVFETLALEYPKVNESNTINLLYNNGVTHGGPITVYSPIPSLAYHMSYETPVVLTNSMRDWKEEWYDTKNSIS